MCILPQPTGMKLQDISFPLKSSAGIITETAFVINDFSLGWNLDYLKVQIIPTAHIRNDCA